MGVDSLAENSPNTPELIYPICLPKPKGLYFNEKKALLGVRRLQVRPLYGLDFKGKEEAVAVELSWCCKVLAFQKWLRHGAELRTPYLTGPDMMPGTHGIQACGRLLVFPILASLISCQACFLGVRVQLACMICQGGSTQKSDRDSMYVYALVCLPWSKCQPCQHPCCQMTIVEFDKIYPFIFFILFNLFEPKIYQFCS